MSFAAVLLCGGQSTRMGRDKAFIDWQGRPLWQVQLDKLQQLGPERLLISCRAEQKVGQVFNLSSIASECVFDPPEADDGPLGRAHLLDLGSVHAAAGGAGDAAEVASRRFKA